MDGVGWRVGLSASPVQSGRRVAQLADSISRYIRSAVQARRTTVSKGGPGRPGVEVLNAVYTYWPSTSLPLRSIVMCCSVCVCVCVDTNVFTLNCLVLSETSYTHLKLYL